MDEYEYVGDIYDNTPGSDFYELCEEIALKDWDE